jgi:DNA-binding CsgD family transcriptional regulator/PAS domain-containing protein
LCAVRYGVTKVDTIRMFASDDLARLEAASRTLLSPLSAHSVDAWRQEATRAFQSVFKADSSMFGLPVNTDAGAPSPYFFTESVPDDTLQTLSDFLADPNSFKTAKDPVLDLFFKQRANSSIEALNIRLMQRLVDNRQDESAFYNEVWVAKRLTSVQMLHVLTPTGYASLRVFYDRGESPFGESSLGLLRVLLPSFKAGLDALNRLHVFRNSLDAIDDAVMVLQADGRRLHMSPALVALLDRDPERETIELELRRVGSRIRTVLFPRRGETGTSSTASPLGQARTSRGRYGFRASRLPSGVFGDDAYLVTVRPEFQELPSEDALRDRFGLTRREAEVALLLAEGLTNEQISERLFISPHTAKRHTEQVLAKMEMPSRKGIAMRLMR